MVQVGQPSKQEPRVRVRELFTGACFGDESYLPATTHPQLPPPQTMMSNSSGSGDILIPARGSILEMGWSNQSLLVISLSRHARPPLSLRAKPPLMSRSHPSHTCRVIPAVVGHPSRNKTLTSTSPHLRPSINCSLQIWLANSCSLPAFSSLLHGAVLE
jgi:hypothetical protein